MFVDFSITFLYFFRTRLKTKIKFLSWCLIYTIPLLFISYSYADMYGIFIALLNITLIYTAYEIGYIFNDTYTIKKEVNPTLRLSLEERKYCEDKIFLILLTRTTTGVSILFILYLLNFNYIYSLAVVSLVLLTYFFYNSIRNIGNLPLHFILVNLRYTAIVVPFLDSFIDIFVVILLFPIINLIERSSEPRFKLLKLKNFLIANKSSGRYIYYLVLTVFLYMMFGIEYKLLWVSFYYFSFRFLSVMFLRNSNV